MNLIELINQELGRGFTKSELERIWDLPKNSLSAILNPDNKAKLSKKAEVRVKTYFEQENKPIPSPRIARGKKFEGTEEEMNIARARMTSLMQGPITGISVDMSSIEGVDLGSSMGELTKSVVEKLVRRVPEPPKPPITKSDKIDFLTS